MEEKQRILIALDELRLVMLSKGSPTGMKICKDAIDFISNRSIPSDGWIDVKERLPNDSKFYSIAFETTDQVRRGCYDRLEMKWIDEDGEEYYGVTHYKLPEPPIK